MAKRRNAKKEKAARNKINANKFRKPSTRFSKRGRRWFNQNDSSDNKKPVESEFESNQENN
ncbi:MAG: hypothetical protein ACRC06_18495 [Waterburya sp.]